MIRRIGWLGLGFCFLTGCAQRSFLAATEQKQAQPISAEITWDRLTSSVDRTVCVKRVEKTSYKGWTSNTFDRKDCQVQKDQPIDPLVDPVVDRALKAIKEGFYHLLIDRAILKIATDRTQNDSPALLEYKIRTMVWANPWFRSLLVRKLHEELKRIGGQCSDCTMPLLPFREISLAQLVDYSLLLAWPTPTQPTNDTPTPRYTLHVCSAFNGLSNLPNLDEDLAGFALVMMFQEIETIDTHVLPLFRSLLRHPDFLTIAEHTPDPTACGERELTYLRQELPKALRQNAAFMESLERSARRISNELGFKLQP